MTPLLAALAAAVALAAFVASFANVQPLTDNRAQGVHATRWWGVLLLWLSWHVGVVVASPPREMLHFLGDIIAPLRIMESTIAGKNIA